MAILLTITGHAQAQKKRYGITVNPEMSERQTRRDSLTQKRRLDDQELTEVEKSVRREVLQFDAASSFEKAMTATPQNATQRVNSDIARGVMDASGLCSSCRVAREAQVYGEARSRSQHIIKNERARTIKPQWKRATVRSEAVRATSVCGTRTGRGYTRKNGSVQWQDGGLTKSAQCYTATPSRSGWSEVGTSRSREQGR